MDFYLGTHKPHWLRLTDVPLFVSRRRLVEYRTPPRAAGPWALDSGGFTELDRHGRWTVDAMQYSSEVRAWKDRVGGLRWAAQQDWMCEPRVIARTGFGINEHQRQTVENFVLLRRLAPDLPWLPVLQGWTVEDYLRCLDRFGERGVDLRTLPLVGLGSVCRRQGTTEIAELVAELSGRGLRLHAFGMKLRGLDRVGHLLASADSLAWSLDARRSPPLPGHRHRSCANCLEYALRWRAGVLARVARPKQRTLPEVRS